MNNRDYKQFGSGAYYHIFNRGNGKQQVFLTDEDFKVFLFRLKENLFPEIAQELNKSKPPRFQRQVLPSGAFSLICYCLMPNHLHFLIRQNTNLSVSELMKKVCSGYAKFFNKTHEKTGSLFEHKFKAITIDSDSYLVWLSAYIHQNPKVAGIVGDLNDWQYSSYLDYLGKRNGKLCEKEVILGQFKNSKDYEVFTTESYQKIKDRKDLQYLLLDEE